MSIYYERYLQGEHAAVWDELTQLGEAVYTEPFSADALAVARITSSGVTRLRSGNAPHILAAFRNLVITLIHRTGSRDIAASRQAFAYHPARALALLFR